MEQTPGKARRAVMDSKWDRTAARYTWICFCHRHCFGWEKQQHFTPRCAYLKGISYLKMISNLELWLEMGRVHVLFRPNHKLNNGFNCSTCIPVMFSDNTLTGFMSHPKIHQQNIRSSQPISVSWILKKCTFFILHRLTISSVGGKKTNPIVKLNELKGNYACWEERDSVNIGN